jgi:hypothetical protein
MSIRDALQEREMDQFVESPTRAGKTAVEVSGTFTVGGGPLDVPPTTDFISGVVAGSDFVITYKSGGSAGTTLKTITLNYVMEPFEVVIA